MTSIGTREFETLAAIALAQKTNELPISQLLNIHERMLTHNKTLVQYVRANKDFQEKYIHFVQSSSMKPGS